MNEDIADSRFAIWPCVEAQSKNSLLALTRLIDRSCAGTIQRTLA